MVRAPRPSPSQSDPSAVAMEAVQAGDLRTAFEFFAKAVNEDKRNASHRYNFALCAEQVGEIEAAAREYSNTLHLNRNHKEAPRRLASLLRRYELNDHSLATLLPDCTARGIGVINASPTGMGLLTARGVPSWHPAPKAMIEGARRAVEYCQSVGADIVQLAVQFAISYPAIATTLVGSASADNIRKNVAYAEAAPDFELIGKVLEILRPIHNHNFTRGRPENRDEPIP